MIFSEVKACSVGSERLPYKQRVGGSTPSAPTELKIRHLQSSAGAFFVCPTAFFAIQRHISLSLGGGPFLTLFLHFPESGPVWWRNRMYRHNAAAFYPPAYPRKLFLQAWYRDFYLKYFLKNASILSNGMMSILSYKSVWLAPGTISSSLLSPFNLPKASCEAGRE